MGAGPVVAWRH